MEPRFGYDFSGVRTHTSAEAAQSAQAVSARAFTAGNHVVFGDGQYQPSTSSGQRLLAHELSHVIQQSSSGRTAIQRAPLPDAQVAQKRDILKETIVAISAYEDSKTGAVAVLSNGSRAGLTLDENKLKPGTYRLKADGTIQGKHHYRIFEVNRNAPDEVGRQLFHAGDFEWTTPLHGADLIDLVILSKQTEAFFAYVQENYGAHLSPADRVRIAEAVQESGLTPAEWYQLKKGGRKTKTSKEAVDAVNQLLASRKLEQLEAAEAESTFQTKAAETMTLDTGLVDGLAPAYKDLKQQDALSNMHSQSDIHAYLETYSEDPFPSDLPERINGELAVFGITGGIPEFRKRIAAFEELFRTNTVRIAVDLLRNADRVCDRFLTEGMNSQFSTEWNRTAKQMETTLAPSRDPLEKIVDAADEQAGKANGEAVKEMMSLLPDSSVIDAKKAEAEQATAARETALDQVGRLLPQFPFIAWPDFPREKLLRETDPDKIMLLVDWYLHVHQAAIRDSLSQLASDSKRIYKLDILVSLAKEKMLITPGSIFAMIIDDAVEDASHESVGEKLKTALLFGLMIASFFVTGGASIVVGVSIAGLSASQAYDLYSQYNDDLAAHKANLSSVEPSEFWVIASIIGAGLDAKGALDLFANSAGLRKAIEAFSKGRSAANLIRLEQDLAKLAKAKEITEDAAKAIRDDAEKQIAQQAAHGADDASGAAANTGSPAPSPAPAEGDQSLLKPGNDKLDTTAAADDSAVKPAAADTTAAPAPDHVPAADTPPVPADPATAVPAAPPPAPLGRRGRLARDTSAAAQTSLNNTRTALKNVESRLEEANRRLIKANAAVEKAEREAGVVKDLTSETKGARSGQDPQLKQWRNETKKAVKAAKAEAAAADEEIAVAKKKMQELEKNLEAGEAFASQVSQAQKDIEKLESDLQAANVEQHNFGKEHHFPTAEEEMKLKLLKDRVTKLEKDLAERIKDLKPEVFEALRRGTPGPGAAQKALQNMRKVAPHLLEDGVIDVTSETGERLAEAVQSSDHIYPVEKIMRDPDFLKLGQADRQAVLELEENYFILSKTANSSKGSRTMAEWFKTPLGSKIPLHLRQGLIDAETAARKAVKDFIKQRISNAANVP